MNIDSLYRYPVKGLSPEKLSSVQLDAGNGFPLDRKYALLRTEAAFDAAAPVWLAKANFVMLMLHEQVAALQTRYSEVGEQLRIRTPAGHERTFALNDPAQRTALEQYFLDFLPKRLSAAPRLVEARGHQFTDKAEKYVSLINLATVRELEKRWGQTLDPLRFRANIYIDGAGPFVELDWVGQEIRLGHVIAEVMQRNGRCAATNVNPQTGARDRDVPGKLRAEFAPQGSGNLSEDHRTRSAHRGGSGGCGTGDPGTPAGRARRSRYRCEPVDLHRLLLPVRSAYAERGVDLAAGPAGKLPLPRLRRRPRCCNSRRRACARRLDHKTLHPTQRH